jgi:glycosyltransferase involved in cell wall biosynthesis
MNHRVTVIQEHLPHYRKRFFQLAREELKRADVTLDLIHGRSQDPRFITSPLEWARQVPIRRLGPFSWHSQTISICRNADLVIVPQELKYILSHLLQLWSRFGGPKFSFWGHGKNFQTSNPSSKAEACKRYLSKHTDWWFAYNDLSSKIVQELGYPSERITSVGNAIDTSSLIKSRESIGEADLAKFRVELGLCSENVAVFTGGLYEHKRIGFLLEAARLIRTAIPDFQLIIIGDGPERSKVTEAARAEPWILDIGPKDDIGKIPYWAMAKLLLMPGLVGLVVVDSFALGVPLVTTDYPFHSPEIDYLKNGVNGLLIPCGDNVGIYAEAVCGLLRDPERLEVLRQGATASASEHSIEKMVDNFKNGVLATLAAPRLK